MGLLVEICCGSVEDVVQSERGGAHRVELCSALALGGLTPSAGTIAEAKRLSKLPVMVIIRLRSGGFCYTETEFATMEREIELAAEQGADGLVFGVLREDGTVDERRSRRLIERAGGLPTVFHRAFDVTPDPFSALEAVINMGATRLLTSGQQPGSLAGSELIRELVERADGRIEIMPGGGVRLANLSEIFAKTGCHQVHLTAHQGFCDTSTHANRTVAFNTSSAPPEDQFKIIDSAMVAAVVSLAAELSKR